jgi:intein/homing endonuclease
MQAISLAEIEAALSGTSPDGAAELARQADAVIGGLKFIPHPGPQTLAYHSKADVLLFGGNPGGGKLLDEDTYVPVPLSTDPKGWKRHGDIRPGDFVFSPSGRAVMVFERHDTVINPDAYELELDTGEVFLADAQHYWYTWNRRDRDRVLRASEQWRANRKANRPSRAVEESKKPWVSESISRINKEREHDIAPPQGKARTTQEIAETLTIDKGARLNHSIAIAQPIQMVERDLTADPYLLGLWLGDGYTRSPNIIMMSSDWLEIERHTPEPKRICIEGAEKNRKQEVQIRRFSELRPFVTKSGGKRIPAEYLRAGYHQRLELLRGLCDTDGTCDHRGQVELGFSNKDLAHDAHELINSLGIKTSIRRKEMKSDKHADHWRMKFIAEELVFKLPRKSIRQKRPERKTTGHRYIVRVEKAAPKPMNCLTVEGKLYLIGRSFVTTHNTGLLCGLALNNHRRSLVVRKQFTDLDGVLHTLTNILGSFDGLRQGNRPRYASPDGRVIDFMGMGDSLDGKQGNPHDAILVDEGAQLPEDQVRMLLGWMRTDVAGQRCRMVIASNPPLDSTGDWLIEYFGPWLNPQHPNPAQQGELRYFLPRDDGGDRECSADEFILLHGVKVMPQSRTFIESKFTDNPTYDQEQYAKALAGLPDSVRDRLMSGSFLLDRSDDVWQTIPTQWVREAQERWTPTPPVGVPMCAIGVDIAQGGSDDTVLAPRHDGWYAPLLVVSGAQTPDGKTAAGLVVSKRRDGAKAIVDIGGGWGGDCHAALRENGIDSISYMGVKDSKARTSDRSLGFTNVRSQAYWRFREALDPSQPGGSPIMLPRDSILLADLCAPRYEVVPRGIKLESKEDVVKRLGRSPDRGDAVVMAWHDGLRMSQIKGGFPAKNSAPQVNRGHQAARRR